MKKPSRETRRRSLAPAARELPAERATRVQILLWVALGYLAYAGLWYVLGSYGRYRFHVLRDAEIARIAGKRAHLIATAQKAAALTALDEWLPYRICAIGSIVIWGALAIAAAVAMFRDLVRRRKLSVLHIKFTAVAIVLASFTVVLCGVAAPLLIELAWERYLWLSW